MMKEYSFSKPLRDRTNQEFTDFFQMVRDKRYKKSVDGKIKRNTTMEVSSLLSVDVRVVQQIWKQAKQTPNGTRVDVSHKKTKRCGRKRVQFDFDLDRKSVV